MRIFEHISQFYNHTISVCILKSKNVIVVVVVKSWSDSKKIGTDPICKKRDKKCVKIVKLYQSLLIKSVLKKIMYSQKSQRIRCLYISNKIN